MVLSVPHKQYQSNKESQRNDYRNADFLTVIDAGILGCQAVQNDVSEYWDANNPKGHQQNEKAYLVSAV